MEKVREPSFRIEIEYRDVTEELKKFVSSLRYTDHIDKADVLEVELNNPDGRFFGAWFPGRGTLISLSLGYENKLLDCGTFRISELLFSGFPHTVTLFATSWVHTEKNTAIFREKKTNVWENATLSMIVEETAKEYGYQPHVKLKEDIEFGRIEQNNITAYEFLVSLAKKYGYTVKIYREKLFFFEWEHLQEQPPSMKLTPRNIIRYRIKDIPREIYKKAVVQYYDPKTKELKEYIYEDKDIEYGGTYKVIEKAESLKQAIAIAKKAIRAKNAGKVKPVLTLEGNPSIVAGMTLELDEFGIYSGKYLVERATHSISSRGYITEVELQRCYGA